MRSLFLFIPVLAGTLLQYLLAHEARAVGPPRHDITARLVPEKGRIEVVDRIELGEGGTAGFRLNQGLVRPRATLDGEEVELRRSEDAWELAETPEGATLTLEYAFEVPSEPASGGPFLGPGGGFIPAWAGWFPDTGDDRFAFDLTVEAPSQVVVATGELVEETRKGGIYRARFRSRHAGEPPSLFSGRYVVVERAVEETIYRTYFTEGTADLADLYIERAAGYVARFAEQIGAYPYDGFAIVAAPIPVGLGFAGLTYVSERILPLPFMQGRSLAHEVVHNWFGNAVRVDYGSGNWAEGLTTYLADYGILDDPAERRAMRLAWLRDYNALPPDRDIALEDFVAKSHDADQIVGYDKTAFVFHMLRRRLGEGRFAAGLQHFYEAHRFATAGWSDLQASFEAVSGRDLERFFAQWLERKGAPRLTLEDATVIRNGSGFEVQLALAQDEPFYDVRVPVRVETAAGTERVEVPIEGERTVALIPTDARPHAVAVDPGFDVFRRLAAGEAPPILRDVLLDRNAQAVVLADGAARSAAERLIEALLGSHPATTRPLDEVALDDPMILVGLEDEIDAALGRMGLEPPPEAVGGTAAVWVAPRNDAPPALVVRVEDQGALEALIRPLPHYRQDSWLRFEGSRAVARGVWPAGQSALSVRLE